MSVKKSKTRVSMMPIGGASVVSLRWSFGTAGIFDEYRLEDAYRASRGTQFARHFLQDSCRRALRAGTPRPLHKLLRRHGGKHTATRRGDARWMQNGSRVIEKATIRRAAATVNR